MLSQPKRAVNSKLIYTYSCGVRLLRCEDEDEGAGGGEAGGGEGAEAAEAGAEQLQRGQAAQAHHQLAQQPAHQHRRTRTRLPANIFIT